MIALRTSDRELAVVVRSSALLWRPERVAAPSYEAWWKAIGAEIKRLRVRVHTGWLADSMTARAMTWTRRDIAIGDGAEDSPLPQRDPLYTEELCHVVEIPFWDGRFQGAYVFSPRARWAIEMQPTAAILRWHRVLGTIRAKMVRIAERRAESFAKPFPGYNLGRIRDLRGETVRTLVRVIDGKA